MTLLKVSLFQGTISYEEALGVEMDMYESIAHIDSTPEGLKELAKQIRGHLFDIKEKSLCDKNTINKIDNHIKLLLQ